jgi:hypothetical protein
VHFEVVHEFDIPLDALELAVISPNLFQALSKRLWDGARIESVEQKEHALTEGRLDRLWSYRAHVRLPAFAARYVTPEMCAWDETSTYDFKRHASSWSVIPHVKPEWRKLFCAEGTYTLEPLGSGRTRRTIAGTIDLVVPVLRSVAEKLIFGEVKKSFEAEAETLRELATLV